MSSRSIRLQVPDKAFRGGTGLNLWVMGIHYPPERGFVVRVFIGQSDADADTPAGGNPRYLGRGVVMARPHFPGTVARGLPAWADPSIDREPDPPLSFRLDATEAVRTLVREGASTIVTLVVVDPSGAALPEEILNFDGVEFRIAGESAG